MVNPLHIFYIGKDTLFTRQMLRQLDIGRNRFHRHPLYRRWSHYAYNNPVARNAERMAEKIAEYGPSLTIIIPLMFGLSALLFGKQGFAVAVSVTAALFALLSLVVLVGALSLATGLSAWAVARERLEGRWDLVMLIPKDRATVLWMRVSSMLHPYRPMMVTLEVLQNGLAIVAVFIVAIGNVDDSRLGVCLAFFIPALVLISWERYQDYALGVVSGTLMGLQFDDRRAFSLSLAATGFIIALRMAFVMIAYGISTPPGGFETVVPGFIGGVTVLPMVGIPLWACLVVGSVYVALREAVIALLWRASLRLIDNPSE
ncbi:MAG: hypothetical protein KJ064_18330 [Anaerolineae bacterium]|nr:MAG: hypothetical protein F9K27_07325 [Anaerolineae bacterium]MCL4878624.1 hypothetical protein [Anaerolineae bacterium]